MSFRVGSFMLVVFFEFRLVFDIVFMGVRELLADIEESKKVRNFI